MKPYFTITSLFSFPGVILRLKPLFVLKTDDLYEDEKWWVLEGEEDDEEAGHKGSASIPMTHADNGTR